MAAGGIADSYHQLPAVTEKEAGLQVFSVSAHGSLGTDGVA